MRIVYWNLQLLLLNFVFLLLNLSLFKWILRFYYFLCLPDVFDRFTIMKYFSLCLTLFLVVKSMLSDMNIATPVFLWMLFHGIFFSQTFTLNMFVFLNLKCFILQTTYSLFLLFYSVWQSLPFDWILGPLHLRFLFL